MTLYHATAQKIEIWPKEKYGGCTQYWVLKYSLSIELQYWSCCSVWVANIMNDRWRKENEPQIVQQWLLLMSVWRWSQSHKVNLSRSRWFRSKAAQPVYYHTIILLHHAFCMSGYLASQRSPAALLYPLLYRCCITLHIVPHWCPSNFSICLYLWKLLERYLKACCMLL